MRVRNLAVPMLILSVAVAGCGDDKKSAADDAAAKIAKQTGLSPDAIATASKLAEQAKNGKVDPKMLEDARKLAEKYKSDSLKGVPKPCSILTSSVVSDAIGGEPKKADDSADRCSYDIEGVPNFMQDGATPLVAPTIELRLERSSVESFNTTAGFLGGEKLSSGPGSARTYQTLGGGIYSWIRSDGVRADLQLVTIGSVTDAESIKSTLAELAEKIDSKL
ncbi:MAG: hypothetical protein WBD02_04115 [Acidimicrobiia bacterium]